MVLQEIELKAKENLLEYSPNKKKEEEKENLYVIYVVKILKISVIMMKKINIFIYLKELNTYSIILIQKKLLKLLKMKH